MLSQKTFLKLIELKGWVPVDRGERFLDFSNMVKKYYLTFKGHEGFKCLCSKKNRDKILKED